MATQLHVGNLNSQTTDQQLRDLFAESGSVVQAHAMNDGGANASHIFGLVQMTTYEDAQAAIQAIHGRTVGGQVLTVRLSIPRSPGWEGGNDQGGRNRSHGIGGNGGSRW